MHFDRKLIFVKSGFVNKEEVITFLGNRLVEAGAVEPDYVQAMHKREQDIGTYITEGVAIPHGTEASRSMIKKSAVAVLKIPQGIEWVDGNKVFLAFGIAGNNDEHVELLGSLATILMDDDTKAKLMAAAGEEEVYACLEESIQE